MKIIASIFFILCLPLQAVEHEFKAIIDARLIYTIEQNRKILKNDLTIRHIK